MIKPIMRIVGDQALTSSIDTSRVFNSRRLQ
jgi:hypothetical protein